MSDREFIDGAKSGVYLGAKVDVGSLRRRGDGVFVRRRRVPGRGPIAGRAASFFIASMLGAGSVRAAYPFQTRQELLDDILECLTAVPSGRGCCAAGHCSNAGNVEMPDWDVSGITDMVGLFFAGDMMSSAHGENGGVAFDEFNVDISRWDVSSVTDMSEMFKGAAAFNHPLEMWDVSSVTDMSAVFCGASAFNQPLARWNVSSVTEMSGMFWGASAFNRPLEAWNVASVVNMGDMFRNAAVFNQPLASWDVSSVYVSPRMFMGASAFNQNLSAWDVSSGTEMSEMFKGATNFNRDITGWSTPHISQSESQSMFEGATAWLATYYPLTQGSVDGPPSRWVPPYQFQSKQELVDEIHECLTAVPSGAGCCAAGHCSYAGSVEMPYWDVSRVTDMRDLFFAGDSVSTTHGENGGVAFDEFNVDISRWDVSSVVNMYEMFRGAAGFNQPLDAWDVSSVTDMSAVFWGASAFNQPLASWNVSSVMSMGYMFHDASSFDRDITGWSTPSLTSSYYMFDGATAWLEKYASSVPGSNDGPPSRWTSLAPPSTPNGAPNGNSSSPGDNPGPASPPPPPPSPPRVLVTDDDSGTSRGRSFSVYLAVASASSVATLRR